MRQRISRRYFSLSTLLAVSFGGLMLLAVGSVLIVSLGGRGAKHRRASGRQGRPDPVLHRAARPATSWPVMAQAEYLKNSIERGQLDVEDARALETALRSALAATPQVTGIGFIRSDLEVARVERRDGTLITEDWSRQPEIIKVFEDFRAGKGAGWGEPVWSSPFQQTIIPYHHARASRAVTSSGSLSRPLWSPNSPDTSPKFPRPCRGRSSSTARTRCWLTRPWPTNPRPGHASAHCRSSPRSTTRFCKRYGRLSEDR